MAPSVQPTGALDSDLSASARVLGIPELLQIILPQVPLGHLTALRHVARHWNNIISEINHIDPIAIGHGEKDCRCLGVDTCAHIPHYSSHIAIKGNPVFQYCHRYQPATKGRNGESIPCNTQRHYRELKTESLRNNCSELGARGDQFITDPPVTLVAIRIPGFASGVQAMLRVPTGIRVSDIQDLFAKMYDSSGAYHLDNATQPVAWYGCISNIIRGTSDTGNGEAQCDDGNNAAAKTDTLSRVT